MSSDITRKNLFLRFAGTREAFLFGVADEVFGRLKSACSNCLPPVAPIGEAFIANLQSAAEVASIPFRFAQGQTSASLWQSIFTAELIRQGPVSSDRPEEVETLKAANEESARKIAQERIAAHLNAPENMNGLIARILGLLETEIQKSATFERAASDLIYQGVVMIWGALEAFVTDLCVCVVNEYPERGITLLTTDPARKHLAQSIALQDLARHGLNLSSSLGTILFIDKRSESAQLSLQAMRDILPQLLGRELAAPLGSSELWTLAQQRHLIVHRAGIVDKAFQSRTGTQSLLGQRLTVSSTELEKSIELISEIGSLVLLAAAQVQKAARPSN